MLFIDFAIALIFAIIAATILTASSRETDVTWLPAYFFFLFLFMPLIWAGGVWLQPIDPLIYDINVLGFAAVAVVLLLFAYALMTPSGRRRKDPILPEHEGERKVEAAAFAFSIFAWFALALSAIALIAHYAVLPEQLV